ncbi:unnamed protein product [Arctogadus glacialis]
MLSHHESEPERRSAGYLAEDVLEGTIVQGLDLHSKLSFAGVIFKTPGMPETTAMPRDYAQALRFRSCRWTTVIEYHREYTHDLQRIIAVKPTTTGVPGCTH